MHGEFMGSACGHHGPYTPDVLFWSCILFFATFIVSSTLKTFKTSRYFPTRVGSMLLLRLFGPAGCQSPSLPRAAVDSRLFQHWAASSTAPAMEGGSFKTL